jgi:ABC-2 type transport system permease protein
MRHALVIARREIESYFVSPVAYAVLAVFTFVSGLFFSNMLVHYVKQGGIADAQLQRLGRSEFQLDVPTVVLQQFFQNEAFLLMFALPLVTMGLITDERRKGTLELLMTSPVTAWELAAGKFFGAVAFLAVMVLPLAPMFVFLAQGGEWEPGVVACGFLGLLLVGAAQIALGLWVSSLCEHVLVSAIGTYGLLMTLQFIDTTASASRTLWTAFLSYCSLYMRQANLTRGLVSADDVIFFLSLVALGVFLAQRTIDAIRYTRT